MSDDLTKFLDALTLFLREKREAGQQITFAELLHAIGNARYEATQPEPAPVPELPEWLGWDKHGDYWIITLPSSIIHVIRAGSYPNDLDRIAEACRILAARERARREG